MPSLLLTSIAAASPPGPPLIVNGQVEQDYPSVVAVGADGVTFCTGNLITPRIVLTAAHCELGLPPGQFVRQGSVYFGTRSDRADHERDLAEWIPHPNYDAYGAQRDVGILVLSRDAPEEIEPVWFNTTDLKPRDAIGEVLTSVGFGVTESGDFGQKRSAKLKVADIDPLFLISNAVDNRNGANVCSGDSGGPQFHEDDPLGSGERLQWAVHTWADRECTQVSGSTRTDVVANFILDEVEAVHGTRDRCAILGRYDDGICETTCDEPDPDCDVEEDSAADASQPTGCGCRTGGVGGLAAITLSTTALAAAASWRRRRSR